MAAKKSVPESDLVYVRGRHAAAHTDSYLFHQLIPYIGNKRRLLDLIGTAVSRTDSGPRDGIFADLFAGSGVVARWARMQGWRVLVNDWEPYAEALNRAAIGCDQAPAFVALGGYKAAIAQLNSLVPLEGWVTRHLCPADDDAIDHDRERLFYTRANGRRIDAIRTQIAAWDAAGLLTPQEHACLLAPLLYQACYTSNTSGVFKGFHRGWGGATATALYRIHSRLTLAPLVFHPGAPAGVVTRRDAAELAAELPGDTRIVYLDPPYNQHPYASNYHVLNTLTLWDAPPLSREFSRGDKAAIRTDWRTTRRSAYNHRGDAATAYSNLLTRLDVPWILTSYSTDGMIPLEQLVQLATERGPTRVVLRGYKRYRVSSQRFSRKPMNVEFVLVTGGREGQSADELVTTIREAETGVLAAHREAGRFLSRDPASVRVVTSWPEQS